MTKTTIIKISSNHVSGMSHNIDDKNITRLSNFILKYKVIIYITNNNNNNCEFVNGSSGLVKLIIPMSLLSISDENTSNYNDNNSWNNPFIKIRCEFIYCCIGSIFITVIITTLVCFWFCCSYTIVVTSVISIIITKIVTYII